MNTVNIADYGASTKAKNNASSIQKAIDAAVVVPAGVQVHNELTAPLKQIDERQVNARNLQLEYTIV